MAKSKHGGKRSGAGRKPTLIKKMPLFIYPLEQDVNKITKETAKVVAEQAISKAAKKCG